MEQEQKIIDIKEDVQVLFKKVNDVERNGTAVCGTHNARSEKWNEQCKARAEVFSNEITEIKKEMKFKWGEAMRISGQRDQQIRDMDTALNTACTLRDQNIRSLRDEFKDDLKDVANEIKTNIRAQFGLRDKIMLGIGLGVFSQLIGFVFWYLKSGGSP